MQTVHGLGKVDGCIIRIQVHRASVNSCGQIVYKHKEE